jgi:pyridoxamine 5'-phosphate oxidase
MTAIPENPVDYFRGWFEQAGRHEGIEEANAVNVATADSNGMPSSRMVLLKSFDDNGFVFYTNLGSRKARQLAQNPCAAMCFYWEPLARQVRIEGRVTAVDSDQADAYFQSRPFKSKIGAWASKQSQALDDQTTLLKEIARQAPRYVPREVPRPPFWSGFCLVPGYFEFWQRGEYRLHRRHTYRRDESGKWHTQLLYP